MNEMRISKDIPIHHLIMSDVQAFFDAEQDAEAKRNFMTTPKGLLDVKEGIKNDLKEYRKRNPASERFVILYKGNVSGWIALNQLNNRFSEHNAKVDFCLHKDYRGKGIMTKVLSKFVVYAFKHYRLKRLEAWTRIYNKAAARLNKRSGFKLEGILRRNKHKDGEYLDDMIWAIVK